MNPVKMQGGLVAEKIRHKNGRLVTHWVRKDKPVGATKDVHVLAGGLVGQEVRWAQQLIDKVHSDGPIPPIKVQESKYLNLLGKIVTGSSESRTTGLFSGMDKTILLKEAHHEARSTFVHEFGHIIDQFGLSHHIGSTGFGTHHKEDPDPMGWAMTPAGHPLLQGWKDAIVESRAFAGTLMASMHSPEAKRYADYLLKPTELFARSYTQYIAAKTGDPTLNKQLLDKKHVQRNGVPFQKQWDTDDFHPIAKAFDKLFSDLHWLHETKPAPQTLPGSTARVERPRRALRGDHGQNLPRPTSNVQTGG